MSNDINRYFQIILEAENKTKTKTADPSTVSTDWDQVLNPSSDNITKLDTPNTDSETSNSKTTPKLRQADQASTLRATANITPSDHMRDLLNRMQIDPEQDAADDPGYPNTEVTAATLPAVVSKEMQAVGSQAPEFHQVANLPGNMSSAIRSLGRKLFAAMTTTPTDQIYMIGNVMGQGPNSSQEINAVTAWIKNTGQRRSSGDIDFERSIPGYRADIQQYTAGGIRWLLVSDEFGRYIYSWPESQSIDIKNTKSLAQTSRALLR